MLVALTNWMHFPLGTGFRVPVCVEFGVVFDRPSPTLPLVARHTDSTLRLTLRMRRISWLGHTVYLGLANDPSFPWFPLSKGPWPVLLWLCTRTHIPRGRFGVHTKDSPKRYSKCFVACMTFLLISSHSPSRPSKATLEQANVYFPISHVVRIRSHLRPREAGLRQVRTPPALHTLPLL